MNYKNIVQLILTIICFLIVSIGSVLAVNDNQLLNVVLSVIILISIIIQIIAIINEREKK